MGASINNRRSIIGMVKAMPHIAKSYMHSEPPTNRPDQTHGDQTRPDQTDQTDRRDQTGPDRPDRQTGPDK